MLSMLEIDILRFLNEFGFCEIDHIIKKFPIKKSSSYDYMKRLIARGWVMNARIIKYQPRAYYLTAKGIDLLKLDLPMIRNIPLHIYEHHLAVIDVAIRLSCIYPETSWISERRLCRIKENANDHLPDGVLVFENKKCAIEVEKTPKTKDRLKHIILDYGLQNTYQEVWYFCSASTMSVVSHFASSMPYIKLFKLVEYLR